jgi:hypothetical protein
MNKSKPARIPCVQLLDDYRCALFGKPERPAFCASLRPTEEMCGANRGAALAFLTRLEVATQAGRFPKTECHLLSDIRFWTSAQVVAVADLGLGHVEERDVAAAMGGHRGPILPCNQAIVHLSPKRCTRVQWP